MFLRILIFLIIFFYLLKLIGQIFLPLFITRRMQKMEKDKDKAYHDFIYKKKKEEGKVTIDRKIKNRDNLDKKTGEYVDYEEIE